VADIGLQAVEGQHDAALVAQQGFEALGVGGAEGLELVVAVEQVGDGAWGNGEPAAGQLVVDLGDAAVFGVSESADEGEDVKAELVVGQGEVGLGLRTVGPAVA
jgi:hypothetical protein